MENITTTNNINSFNQFLIPEPTVSVSVSVKLYYTNSIIKKEFEITKDQINEINWSGGNTGYDYFDDLDNDDDRLISRVNDVVQHLINADPDLDNSQRWEIEYFGEYDLQDFI